YDASRFSAATIRRMLGHFQQLLENVVSNPERLLGELSLLTPAERQQLLTDWNGTTTRFSHDACVHQLFEAQVQRTPNHIAAVFEKEQLSYRELNARADALAAELRDYHVGPEVLVGIYTERS